MKCSSNTYFKVNLMMMKVIVFLFIFVSISPTCFGSYEFIKVAQVWPSAFCRINHCKTPVPRTKFIVHGVWPSNYTGPEVGDCMKDSEDVAKELNMELVSIIFL